MYGRARIVAVAGLPAVAAFGEDASCLRAAVAPYTYLRAADDGTKIAVKCESCKANVCPSLVLLK